MWFRHWHGAVRVVVCQCRRIEIEQFLLVRPVNPFLNLVNVESGSETMFAWKLAQGSKCQARGQGVLCGGAWAHEFPIRHGF